MVVTPAQFEETMLKFKEEVEKNPDYAEIAEWEATNTMCDILRGLGYDKAIDIFEELPKWYEDQWRV